MDKRDHDLRFSWAEMKKVEVITRCLEGRLSAYDASEMLGVSRRHIFRLKKAFKAHGAKVAFHGNLGKTPVNKSSSEVKEKVLAVFDEWRAKTDLGVNCAHLEDILKADGVSVSRQTIWRWTRATGRRMPMRTWKKHRKSRERSVAEGQILFLDGSEHPWFGRANPSATLILCTDDATSKALHGVFVQYENLAGCFEVAHSVFSKFGLPHCFYLDRASQFKTTRKRYEGTIAPPTHWQEALATFGVRCIFAYSPQARGRGERINGTFQGRLASELQFQGITTIGAATKYLNEVFIPAYNERFGQAAKEKPAWRPKPSKLEMDATLAVRELRLVSNDNCIYFEKVKYQILPDARRMHIAKASVEIRKTFDGTVTIVHKKFGPMSYAVIGKRNVKKVQPKLNMVT